jgi:hypothetical protein
MARQAGRIALPPLPGLVAAGLVILGVLLSMFVAEGFLALAGLGAFGPGILRELGWLRDHDEFQRQAAHRAGYHAYLIGGLAAAFVVSALRSRGEPLEDPAGWVMLILVVLWTTWLFSSLLAYWGARKTASAILTVFGLFWTVFVLASIIGTESQDVTVVNMLLASLMGSIVVVPFFVLARKAGRWPRGTGVALLTVAALFLLMFVPVWVERSMKLPDLLLTATLLIVPLVATGMALLREGPQLEEDGASPDVAG